MTIVYTITDLDELAAMFEENARAAERSMAQVTQARDKNLHKREAVTWRAAAKIVRETRLVEEQSQ